MEAVNVRDDDGDLLVVARDDPPEQDEGEPPTHVIRIYRHLTDEADLEGLRFRDGAADLEAFVAATDLDSRSVLLLQAPVEECYVVRLVGVFREGNGVDAEFCRELRPADVECDAGARDVFAVAIRLPFAGEEFGGLGMGVGGDCEHHPTDPLTGGGETA